MQAPVSSQAVAPQTASVVLHAAVQQFPVPVVPQTLEVQESFSVQAVPSLSTATHAPAEHQKPLAQSVAVVQVVLQLMPSAAQPKLPAQAIDVPAAQAPVASQRLPVNMPPLQTVVPQAVPTWYMQAPELSQPEAPQVVSLVEQRLVQQFPVPAMPQTSLSHCVLAVQAEPGERPLVPPVVVAPVVPPVAAPVVPTPPVVPIPVVPPSEVVDELQPVAKNPPTPTATKAAMNTRMRYPFRKGT